MSDFDVPFPLAVLFLVVACILSYTESASTIAKECKKLGAFYVGQTVYECKEKP